MFHIEKITSKNPAQSTIVPSATPTLSRTDQTIQAIVPSPVASQTDVHQPTHYCYDNSLLLTKNSQESMEWKFRFIDIAKQSIELSPNFCGGSEFEHFLTKLAARMREVNDLKVHIILSESFIDKKNIKNLEIFKKEFGQRFDYLMTDVRLTLSPCLGSFENHEKMMIVDGRYVILGGSGIKDTMATPGDKAPEQTENTSLKDHFVATAFRDTDVIVEGTISQDCRSHFFALYQEWEARLIKQETVNRFFPIEKLNEGYCQIFHDAPQLVKNVKAKVLFTQPAHPENDNPISKKIAKIIRNAKQNIKISQMTFNPNRIIKKALEDVISKESSHITLITNGLNENSPFACRMFVQANRSNYNLAHSVFEFKIPHTLYHKKITTVDNTYTVIGSFNYTFKSQFFDNEVALVVDSTEFTAQVNQHLYEDYKITPQLTYDEQQKLQISLDTIFFSTIQKSVISHFV